MAFIYYNLSNITNAGNQTTILTFVGGVNDLMNGVPALLMLVAIGIVLFLILISKGFNPFQSFTAVLWASLILALILYPMGLITGMTLLVYAILAPVAVFLLWVWGGSEFG